MSTGANRSTELETVGEDRKGFVLAPEVGEDTLAYRQEKKKTILLGCRCS